MIASLPACLSQCILLHLFGIFFTLASFRKICQREVKEGLVLTLETLPWYSALKVHQKSNVNFGEFNVNLNPGWVSKHIHQRYLILMIIIILCLTMLNIMINDSDINILIISHHVHRHLIILLDQNVTTSALAVRLLWGDWLRLSGVGVTAYAKIGPCIWIR